MADDVVRAGPAVRRLRKRENLTQAAMASRLSISPSYLNLIERNQRPVSARVIMALVEQFDFDPRSIREDEAIGGLDGLARRFADERFADLAIDREELDEFLSASPQVAAAFPDFQRIGMLRCVCHEMRLLAQGHIDFVLSGKLTPWDHTPGVIIAQQAGGHVAMLDGSPFNAAKRDGYLLCAANKETWERVRDRFDFLIDPVKPAHSEAPEKNSFPGEIAVDNDA